MPQGRVFITCAARAAPNLAPLIAEVEERLHHLGWRTRLVRRGQRQGLPGEERRRRGQEARSQVQSASCVIHVCSGASIAGQRMHRELAHALRERIPVLLLHAADARERLGVEPADPGRLAALATATGGTVVESLGDLNTALARIDG